MHSTCAKVALAAFICALSQMAAAKPTPEQAENIRAYATQEVQKCYALPQAQIQACVEDVNRRTRQMIDSYSNQPAPAAKATNQAKPISATLVYECNVPALAQSAVTSSLSIWRDAKTQYFAVASRDPSTLLPVKAFGTPGKGNVGFTFQNGISMTVAANGWTTTNKDQVNNKNSLYGPTSSKPNTAAGQCKLSNGGTTKTFNSKN